MINFLVFMGCGLLFITVGIYLIYLSYLLIKTAINSKSWPYVEGEIVDFFIKSQKDSDGDLQKSLYVKYSYSVDGKEYFSENIGFGRFTTSTSTPKLEYLKGDKVNVYYNPNSHQSACLKNGLSFGNLSNVLFGLVFFLGGVLFFYAAILID